MQSLNLPSGLSSHAVELEIYAYLERNLPGMRETLCIDFVDAPAKTIGYSQVFFAAARQEYLSQYIACVNAAGLQVKIVDVDVYALQRAVSFCFNSASERNAMNAILYLTNNNASLIGFTEDDIVFHQYWDITETADFHTQLKNRMQMCNSAIKKVILCGGREYVDMMKSAAVLLAMDVCHVDPFADMRFSARMESEQITARAADFLIACGLSMRNIPKW
jgi:Tfp pilus assembly PilM family ATPase